MRMLLQSKSLGKAIAAALEKTQKTQKIAAQELNVTQGQISHIVAGNFKTKNKLVIKVCNYVNIDPDRFHEQPAKSEIDPDALAALGRACRGPKQKTNVVIRVLRALEDLSLVG